MADISEHFAAIRGIDARAEIEAKRIRERLAHQEKEFRANHWGPAKDAAEQIARYVVRRLAPHDVTAKHVDGWHINHVDMSVHPSFDFEVWPRLPGVALFATQARTPIKAGVTPRNQAELDHFIAGVRSAADALALMLYTPAEGLPARAEIANA